jgi:anti-sigma regulatory factor (Ser/Thr protein kinase)
MSTAAWRSLVAQTADRQGGAGRAFHLDLTAQPTEVRHVRTFLRTELAGYPGMPLDLILLLATELVTNAMLHGRSGIGLDVSLHPEAIPPPGQDRAGPDAGPVVLVGVTDESPTVPRQRPRSRSKEGGRGLQIVRELADEWGWLPLDETGGKIVWFRVNAEVADRSRRPVRERTSRRKPVGAADVEPAG